MEENGMMEWEIVEYNNNARDGDIGESDIDEKRSKLGWILSLGKKVVITGVVIWSVPLLIPPLVVISALGCALSLPFGFVFASYACTDSLMSKLLPPSPPLLLELYDHDEDEEQEQVVALEHDQKQEEEEEEQREAVKDDSAVEMRIEHSLEEKNIGELINAKSERQYLQQSHEIDKPSFNNLNLMGPDTANIVGGNATKTTDDHYTATAPEFREGVVLEVQIDKFMENDGGKKVTDKEDKNGKVEKTVKGAPKKESKGKSSTSKDIERRPVKRKTLGALKFPRKRKELLEGDHKRRDQKLSEEVKGLIILKETETSATEEEQSPQVAAQETSTDKLGSVSSDKEHRAGEQRCIMLGNIDNNNSNKQAVSGNILLNDDDVGNIDSSLGEEHNKLAGVNDESKTNTGVLVSEISVDVLGNDGGIDTKIEQRTVTIYNDPGENYNQSKTIAEDGELKHDKDEIPEVKEEKDACAVDDRGHSDEGLFGDDHEKVWKKMEAIRAIVGYKGPRSDSYVAELKALYLFTGIEPPSDSTEFHNKLCFLMSVIGLK